MKIMAKKATKPKSVNELLGEPETELDTLKDTFLKSSVDSTLDIKSLLAVTAFKSMLDGVGVQNILTSSKKFDHQIKALDSQIENGIRLAIYVSEKYDSVMRGNND